MSNEDISQLKNTTPDYFAWNLNKASAHILELVKADPSVKDLCKSEETKWKTGEFSEEKRHERNVKYSLYVADPEDYKKWKRPDKDYNNKDCLLYTSPSPRDS